VEVAIREKLVSSKEIRRAPQAATENNENKPSPYKTP
jgi:hypothetical protein